MTLLEKGYRSTLHDQNRDAVRLATDGSAGPATEILFDPQTSGGLLAALPAADAQMIVEQLHGGGVPAAIVGRFDDTTPGLRVRT